MQNAIIVHGRPDKEEYFDAQFPSASNFHWIPWLQKQLIINDIKADTPEMPKAYAPDWNTWKKEFERLDITPETILVGHSNGGGFLCRWLSENKVEIAKLVLVAPSFHENEHMDGTFFDFELDPEIGRRVGQIVIFNGLKDGQSVQDSVKKIKETIPTTKVIEFPDNEHFTTDDIPDEFVELCDEVLK